MALMRWDPFREALSLREAMDRLFEESFVRPFRGWPVRTEMGLTVPVDMYETDDNLIVSADLPGLKPEDVDISITENTLTIKGEFRSEEEGKRGNVHFQYYDILGVSRDADEKEIKRAFRRLVRKHHPDVNPGDPEAEERFKEINEAYEVFSEPEKRRKYDQLGADWSRWQQAGGRPSDFDWSRWTTGAPEGQRVYVRYGTPEDLEDLFGGASPFSDFFTQIFGGMGPAPGGFEYQVRPQRGQDYEQELEISLREAYQGTTRVPQKDGRRLEVKIPPGARTGTRVRMAGEGGPRAAGGESGDLYLRVKVSPDPQFERKGDDLYVTVPVDLYTAILGGEVRVPTLSGPMILTILAGTQNGRVFRLRGKGMPRLRQPEQHGDLYAKVDVRLPTDLVPRQRELFEELRRIS